MTTSRSYRKYLKSICERIFYCKCWVKSYQGLFFNKVAKETLAQVFPVNSAKFSEQLFLDNTSQRLLLTWHCFFFLLWISEVCSLKEFTWWSNGKISHKTVPTCVITEIRSFTYLMLIKSNISFKGKEDVLYRAHAP